MITAEQKACYERDGYVVARGLFSPDEVAQFRAHYMALRESGPQPGDDAGVDIGSSDPLKRYPRIIQPHRWDETSQHFMLDPRINQCLTGLLEQEPYAVQTMIYFKPAGARGQALHQDNYFLRVQPGTCMAAWLALDPCDEANGCMQIVPGSHTWPVLCTVEADTSQSFTGGTVPLPDGAEAWPVIMQAGDVLFFNGQLVHGSFPNTTTDRFRRALIGHYIHAEAEKVADWYVPVFRFDGSQVEIATSESGVRCGTWVERDGVQEAELSGYELVGGARE